MARRDDMTFSQEVKKEISEREWRSPCCITAAAYGIACFGKYFDTRGIVLHTENAFIAQWAKSIYAAAGITGRVYVKGSEANRIYEFAVKDPFEVEKLLVTFGHTGDETTVRVRPENLECESCLSAFTGAAFLCCGTIIDPQKGYSLELVGPRYKLMKDFAGLLIPHGIHLKHTTRKGANVLYLRASEQIEDVLTFTGATRSSLRIMDLKVYKDFRNKANRITNCETANIDKIVAANRQVLDAIETLEKAGALAALPQPLREAAALRKENPALSLAELAELSPEPVSKSGLSHRFRKLQAKAQAISEKS